MGFYEKKCQEGCFLVSVGENTAQKAFIDAAFDVVRLLFLLSEERGSFSLAQHHAFDGAH